MPAGTAPLPPQGDIKLEEHKLTEKQSKWLEASQRIGPGAMTKTERQLLEKLYTDMLPREQQDLAAYIEAKFGKKESDPKDSEEKDPIEKMRRKEWRPPSEALRSALAKSQTPRPGKDHS
jgi:hypothetical protein